MRLILVITIEYRCCKVKLATERESGINYKASLSSYNCGSDVTNKWVRRNLM